MGSGERQAWLDEGLRNGWLAQLPGHSATDDAPPEGWDFECAAHSEGQTCCADRDDVYLATPAPLED